MSEFDPSLVGNVFDEEQETVILNMHSDIRKEFPEHAEKAVADALEKKGITQLDAAATPAERSYLAHQDKVAKTKRIWDANGHVPGMSDRITYDDLAAKDSERKSKWEKNGRMVDGVFSTDQPMIIPRVIEETVREAIEPNIVLTPLMQNVNVSNAGTVVTFPAVGNVMIAADIGEGQEYPEQSLEFAGEVTAKVGKSGIAVKLTDEMIRYSMFDIMSMHLSAAGKALIRHKEQKAADIILDNGVTFFDQTSGKKTSGRDSAGALNNTMTLDDLLLMYADLTQSGFVPDTLIVHPLAWFMFCREPVMRALFMQGAGQGAYWQNYQGAVGNAPSFAGGGQSLQNNTFVTDPGQVATTYTQPGIFPVPLRIVVTPFQTVDTSANTTTVTMCKASELGWLLTDETVNTESFDDPARDIMKVKFRERYAFVLANNGQAIRHAKSVNWRAKGYSFDDQLVWDAASSGLPSLDQGSLAF
jgi:hypothetical protein